MYLPTISEYGSDPSDPSGLDADNGIACEELGSGGGTDGTSGQYQYDNEILFESGGPKDGPLPLMPGGCPEGYAERDGACRSAYP